MIYAQVLTQENLLEKSGNFSKTLAMSNHKQNTIQNIKIRASRIVHGSRSDTHRGTSIFNRDFRVNELEAVIGDSCLNKSPRPDGIHGQMIYHLVLSGRQRFLDIINCSWNKGQLPRDWRRSTVIPIKKCGQTDGSPESYQPTDLTSIACKIMEKMGFEKIHFFTCIPTIFSRRNSTTDQLLYFCQRNRDAYNKKPTNHTMAVFLDLSKAFDRVWNNFLVIKLYKMLGIESVIKNKCEVGAFADDIVLWKSDSDLTKLERDINLALEDIRNFALDYKLTFIPAKSMISFFTTNRKLYNFHPNIFSYNQPLTVDKHPKYLGFVLDPEIKGNKHIDNIVLKERKRLNVLRYISGCDWRADAGSLRNTAHLGVWRSSVL
ncbi:putative RNA-directed DNA polymerase from transposon BS [Trichonephila clavipes]|uniref:Putative RNA-directed DNA polymerase from transposon BS n=1 Tax=Trichonephila clavipes TaxID=2585209 RepID=A0A8X7BFF0_TRICX|nr:putative RNA-directed DNA polymerase from transposon BS [Trichonephila clavipes]